MPTTFKHSLVSPVIIGHTFDEIFPKEIGFECLKTVTVSSLSSLGGIVAGGVSVVTFGFGAYAAFGAAYVGYQAVNRISGFGIACAAAIFVEKMSAKQKGCFAADQFLKLVSLAAGIGVTYLLLTCTAAPLALAMVAGCASMQVLDFAIDALFDKILDLEDADEKMKHGEVAINNTISAISFAAGTGASLLLSSVCPIVPANAAAGVATAVGVEVALTNLAEFVRKVAAASQKENGVEAARGDSDDELSL